MILKVWLTKKNRKNETCAKMDTHKKKSIDQISSRLFNPEGSRILALEIRNASLALRIASLFEVMSSKGINSMLSILRMGRKGKVI